MSLLDIAAQQSGPTGQPLIQTPSTPRERFGAEFDASLYAGDRWFNLNSSRREGHQTVVDALHTATGQTFLNPYGPVTSEEMMRLGNQPALIEERKQKLRDARNALQQEAGVGDVLPDPDMVDRQIGEQGEALRTRAARLVDTGNGLAAFAGGALAPTPENIAGLLIPPSKMVFGATTVARGFLAGVGREALYQGATQGALTAASEGLDVLARSETGTRSTAPEVLGNIALGTAAGAVLGGAFHAAATGPKALWERWNRLPEAVKENAPLEVRDAFRIIQNDTIYGDANRLGLPWAMHEKFEREAMDPILRGKAAVLDELRPEDTPLSALASVLRKGTALDTILRDGEAAGRFDLEGLQRGAARVAALPDAELEPFARQVNPKPFTALDRVAAQLEELRGKLETLKAAAPDAVELQQHDAAVAAAVRESMPKAKAPADFTPEPHELETAKRAVRGWDPEKPLQRPTSLVDFVRKSGGLRNDQTEAGDLLAQDIGRQPGLLRSKEAGGIGYDEMARRAKEQGFDIPEDVNGSPDANRFLSMLVEDAGGSRKHYPVEAHTDAFLAQQDYFNEFSRHLKDVLGINPKGMNPRDLAYLLRQDGQSARLMVLLHKAESLGDASSLELAYRLDGERAAALQRETGHVPVDRATPDADHGYPAATLDELERFYADVDRTAGEGRAGQQAAGEEPVARGSAEGGEDTGAGSGRDHPAPEASGTRPTPEQRRLEARLAKLEEQHGKAASEAQAEIAALRGKLDQIDTGQPVETVSRETFGGEPVDVAKALEAAEFDRLIRTVPANAPAGPNPAPSAKAQEWARAIKPTADGLAPEQVQAIDRQARALIAGTPTGRTVVSASTKTLGKDLSLPDLRRAAMEHYRGTLEGTTVKNEITGREITFDGTGRRKSVTGKGSDLLHLVPELPALLRTARPEGAPMPDTRQRGDIVAVHQFRASAALDGSNFDVILTVRERKDGSYHYTLNKDRGESAGGGAEAPRPEPPEGGKDTDLEVSAGPLNMDRTRTQNNASDHLTQAARELDQADEAVNDAASAAACAAIGGIP